MTKRCLYIKTIDLAMNDVMWGILENDNECDCLEIDCNTLDYREDVAKTIVDHVKRNPADVAFTMNFCPTVSKACSDLGIPYASWIYDCPHQSLFDETAHNETNFIFVFDKYMMERLKKRDIPNLTYLPLAANVTRMGKLNISPKDEEEYSCDISFVGLQYIDGRYSYYRGKLPDELKEELDAIAYNMIGRWDGTDRIHGTMSQRLIDEMVRLSDDEPGRVLNLPNRLYFEEAVIARAVAYTERRLMMEKVSDLNPRWYGANAAEKDKIPGVDYRPFLTYEGTLPKAYNLSRINLSSSLHSIFSGAPLRVFDIMGAGGFILTNFQPELLELFDLGKEIVAYRNFDEMSDLARYFLRHEEERVNILVAGYERVCRDYTYPVAVKKMLSTIFSS